MRLLVVAFVILCASCDTCPNGNAENSLFCHGQCAADEATCSGICANLATDRDNCGSCGNSCGDGLVCAFSQCVEPCEGGLINCAGACVDLASDTDNCGGCASTSSDFTCAPTESCSDGVCGCGVNELVCAAGCVDPNTSNAHCGATGDCAGASAGTQCVGQEACLNGNCESTLIYRGSLPAKTGVWDYAGQAGRNGAIAACGAAFPGSTICTFDKLLAASTKAVPETINATATDGAAVTEWWIDDPTMQPNVQCGNNLNGQIPWTYGTADQGNVGTHVVLTAGTGAISPMPIVESTVNGCSIPRFVPCCSIITAP